MIELKETYINLHPCVSRNVPPHKHVYLELAYVTHGVALHKINGTNAATIQSGDYFIIDYKTAHEYYAKTKEFCVINCLFLPELIDKTLLYCKDFQTLLQHYLIKINADAMDYSPVNHIFHDDNGKILAILNEMLEEYEKKQNNYIELLRSDLIRLLIHTTRKIPAGDTPCDITQRIVNTVLKHYNEPITLSDLGNVAGYSLPYLSKKFKEKTGLSFQNYLKKVRINEACRLLAHTDKKIEEIAALSGYRDMDCFRKSFRDIAQCTPGDFRKKILTASEEA